MHHAANSKSKNTRQIINLIIVYCTVLYCTVQYCTCTCTVQYSALLIPLQNSSFPQSLHVCAKTRLCVLNENGNKPSKNVVLTCSCVCVCVCVCASRHQAPFVSECVKYVQGYFPELNRNDAAVRSTVTFRLGFSIFSHPLLAYRLLL